MNGEQPGTRLPPLRLLVAGVLLSGCEVLVGMLIAQVNPPDHGSLEPKPLPLAVRWLAIPASVCVYAAGMVWADHSHGRWLPRAAPAGDLPVAIASILVVAGVVISPCPLHHVLIAALLLVCGSLRVHMHRLEAAMTGALRGLNLLTVASIPVTYWGYGWSPSSPIFFTTGLLDASPAYWGAAACYALFVAAVMAFSLKRR